MIVKKISPKFYQELKAFFLTWQLSFRRRLGIILLTILFIFLPTQNIYSSWQLEPGEPLVKDWSINIPSPSIYPVNVNGKSLPWLSAKSVIVVDQETKAVLFAKEPDWQLYPASTTKMMTALVASQVYDLEQVLSADNLDGVIGQTMELELGEKMTVKNLLYGLLVMSGNDAAEVLARSYPQGEEAFIDLMNKKAEELFLTKTHFKNPSGIEAEGHFSTVHDLALLGAEVISKPDLAKIVATKEITVTDQSGEISHHLTNINQLVGVVSGVLGIKSGWTENAGECLVTYIERNGHKVIVAILGSQDRFGETNTIIDWVFANHQWQKIQPQGLTLDSTSGKT